MHYCLEEAGRRLLFSPSWLRYNPFADPRNNRLWRKWQRRRETVVFSRRREKFGSGRYLKLFTAMAGEIFTKLGKTATAACNCQVLSRISPAGLVYHRRALPEMEESAAALRNFSGYQSNQIQKVLLVREITNCRNTQKEALESFGQVNATVHIGWCFWQFILIFAFALIRLLAAEVCDKVYINETWLEWQRF